jgi:hypothetical protein
MKILVFSTCIACLLLSPTTLAQQAPLSIPESFQLSKPPLPWKATPDEVRQDEHPTREGVANAWTTNLLGRGYNGLSGELRDSCLTGDTASSTGGKRVNYSIYQAGSSEEFRKSVNLSAGATFGTGVWSVDAGVQYFQSVNRSRFVDHMVVRVDVAGPALSLERAKLTNEANHLKRDPILFYRKCGNRFVRTLSIGGEFVAIVNIETTSQEERESLRATLTVIAKGYGSASTEYKQAIEQISHAYQKDIKIIRNGLGESLPNLDIPTLIQYSLDFPAKIDAMNGVPVALEQIDYRAVDPTIEIYSGPEIIVERLSNKFGELFETLGDLDYYARHRNAGIFYPPISDSELRRSRDLLGDAALKAKLAFNSCIEDPPLYCRESLFPEVPVDSPHPAQKVSLNPKIGSSQPIGSAGAGEEKTVLVIGDWSAWDNGENNWWPPERCCFTIEVSRETGPTEIFSYSGPQKFTGPARFSIRIGDSTYSDNRARGLTGIVY